MAASNKPLLESVVVHGQAQGVAAAPGGGAATKAGAAPSSPPPRRRRRPLAALDAARAFALSPNAQLSAQLCVGTLLVSLFVFISEMRFAGACFSYTIFLVTCVMMSANAHVGTRLLAVAVFVGTTWLALIPAGALTTLAKLIGPPSSGPAALALYATAGPLAIALLMPARVAPSPPGLWAKGMNTLLMFGALTINPFAADSVAGAWASIAAGSLAGIGLGCAVTLAVSLLVAPSLASDAVRLELAAVIRATGHAASANASRLLRPGASVCGRRPNGLVLGTHFVEVLPGIEVPDESRDEEAAVIQEMTHRSRHHHDYLKQQDKQQQENQQQEKQQDKQQHKGKGTHKHKTPPPPPTPAKPAPGKASAADGQSGGGKPDGGAGDGGAGDGGGGGCGGTADCESLAPPALGCQEFTAAEPVPLYGLRPRLRGAFMLLPAAAAEPPCLQPSRYDAAAFGALAGAVAGLIDSLVAVESVLADDAVHARAPAYAAALSEAHAQIAAALVAASDAVAASARGGSGGCGRAGAAAAAGPREWERVRRALRAGVAEEQKAYWLSLRSGTQAAPVQARTMTQGGTVFFSYSGACAAIDAAERLQAAVDRAVGAGGAGGRGCAPSAALAWLRPICRDLACCDIAAELAAAAAALPGHLSSRKAVRSLLSSRPFQAGAKIWAVLSLMLIGPLLSLQYVAELRGALSPVVGYIAASLVFAWMGGTLVGGALGLALTLPPGAAAVPAALAACLCAFAALIGTLGSSRFRMVIMLSLMALGAIVLCQHCPEPLPGRRCPGALELFASRVLSVLLGTGLAVLVSGSVLPWYTSAWALETMADAYAAALQLPAIGYARLCGQDGDEAALKAAAAASDAAAGEAIGDAGGGGGGGGGAGARPRVRPFDDYSPLLRARVIEPLTAVQASLLRDTTTWRRGVLSTPCVVHQMLTCMLQLVAPLEAMKAALRPPEVTGALTGALGPWLVMPVEHLRWPMLAALQELAPAVEAHVRWPSQETASDLRDRIDALMRFRVAARAEVARRRVALHRWVVSLPEGAWRARGEMNADDVVLVLGCQHAFIRSLDFAVGVARSVLSPDCKARNSWRCALK
ncbi:hypothetical protein Rsub_11841 [Raphidocelis subcapitata]|uniref:Uncharacterized protein n=1 Tax=Raphidocelis subcapitata TaxID=307507 RepID=A0A2V0PMF9_9CHLO|nr:hypothetical protein Rsub_11841 [Raphidocelis subcapitata]|eukprot:GBF99070.1 hypothetical protein Rsub_11841 [Raphidocelis subcapitata]